MPFSRISNSHLYRGEGALSQLESILEHFKHVLLIGDSMGFDLCGAADYFRELEKNKEIASIKKVLYTGKALPISDIEKIYQTVKSESDIDGIVALGGGTIIDLAKIISIAYSNECQVVEDILKNRALKNQLPLIFIPTTAGTGSETTSFAVVYKDKMKISIEQESLLPKYIILDPLLLKSLPESVLNSTLLDALAQATESIWAKGSTEESLEYSSQALSLILTNITTVNSINRLNQLQFGSYLAGKAINISKTTLSHSISYPLTAHFGIPHGIAVCLTLALVAKLNYGAIWDKELSHMSRDRINKRFSLIFNLYNVKDIDQLVEKLKTILVELKVKSRLRDYGIKQGDLPFIATHSITKGRSDNNPIVLEREGILNLLEAIY
jgi:alcohol dehydrogenase class IV